MQLFITISNVLDEPNNFELYLLNYIFFLNSLSELSFCIGNKNWNVVKVILTSLLAWWYLCELSRVFCSKSNFPCYLSIENLQGHYIQDKRRNKLNWPASSAQISPRKTLLWNQWINTEEYEEKLHGNPLSCFILLARNSTRPQPEGWRPAPFILNFNRCQRL